MTLWDSFLVLITVVECSSCEATSVQSLKSGICRVSPSQQANCALFAHLQMSRLHTAPRQYSWPVLFLVSCGPPSLRVPVNSTFPVEQIRGLVRELSPG